MQSYLCMMAIRLLEMRRVLKPTGSIYLHCDPTASHYIKVMMDAIFGHAHFRNEIIWKRTGSHGGAKRWGPVHDTLLFYTMSSNYTWNGAFQEYSADYVDSYYRYKDQRGRYQLVSLTGAGTRTGKSGKPWRGIDPTDTGRHWAVPRKSLKSAFPDRPDLDDLSTQERLDLLDEAGLIYWPERGSQPRQKRYADENPGVPIQDMISDINGIGAHAKQYVGYPTQKPIALLDRIVAASSNHDDVVFDPFCGCATALVSAEKNGRQWVGIDISEMAVKLVRRRLSREVPLFTQDAIDFNEAASRGKRILISVPVG